MGTIILVWFIAGIFTYFGYMSFLERVGLGSAIRNLHIPLFICCLIGGPAGVGAWIVQVIYDVATGRFKDKKIK